MVYYNPYIYIYLGQLSSPKKYPKHSQGPFFFIAQLVHSPQLRWDFVTPESLHLRAANWPIPALTKPPLSHPWWGENDRF